MNNDIHACRDSIDSLASNCQTNFQKLGATTNGIISNVSDNIERRVEALEHITSTMVLKPVEVIEEEEEDNPEPPLNNNANLKLEKTNIVMDEKSELRLGKAKLFAIEEEEVTENEEEATK